MSYVASVSHVYQVYMCEMYRPQCMYVVGGGRMGLWLSGRTMGGRLP